MRMKEKGMEGGAVPQDKYQRTGNVRTVGRPCVSAAVGQDEMNWQKNGFQVFFLALI